MIYKYSGSQEEKFNEVLNLKVKKLFQKVGYIYSK